jgi:hypothetical protein
MELAGKLKSVLSLRATGRFPDLADYILHAV